jgi:hypothetical protein
MHRRGSLVQVLNFISDKPAVAGQTVVSPVAPKSGSDELSDFLRSEPPPEVLKKRQQNFRIMAASITAMGPSDDPHAGTAGWEAFLAADPAPEKLTALSPSQRKAFKKYIKKQFPTANFGPIEREKALTILHLLDILEDD